MLRGLGTRRRFVSGVACGDGAWSAVRQQNVSKNCLLGAALSRICTIQAIVYETKGAFYKEAMPPKTPATKRTTMPTKTSCMPSG